MKKLIKEKGITLIALVITMVILIIIAAVVIKLSMSENNLLNKAKTATGDYVKAKNEEQNELANYEEMISGTRDIDKNELKQLLKEIIEEEHIDTTPAGTVIAYIAGNDAPEGYLKCDGTVYNISDYTKLADNIKDGLGKYNYFGGDGETTFAVPDLRGEFLRGTGSAGRAYTNGGAAVGVHQVPTLSPWAFADSKNITVSGNYGYEDWGGVYSSGDAYKYVGATSYNGSRKRYSMRPTNTAVLYCIKY